MQTLTATKRSKKDMLSTIRNNGMVPGVVYGARVENTPISVPSVLFGKILKEAGESSTIVLEVKGDKDAIKKIDVLIHEVQVDPVKGQPIHVDFLAIDINKSIQVKVSIEFVGIALGEKNGLGVLVKVLHEIMIEALPKDLPHSVSVDITSLENLNDQIHVKDINLPKGVTAITDPNEVVALLAAVKEEIIEEVVAPVDLSAIEVEKKGKKEEVEETLPAEEKK
jgi:large subunit ribosomal protein L25